MQLGDHSALDPAGPQAARIHDLWQFLWIVSAVVFVVVVAALLYAALRRRPDQGVDEAGAERTMTRTVTGATLVSLVVLFAFLVVSFRAGRALTMPPDGRWSWCCRRPT